jgi:hypothetical protein
VCRAENTLKCKEVGAEGQTGGELGGFETGLRNNEWVNRNGRGSTGGSIKGNVKENTSPSTGRGKLFLTSSPLTRALSSESPREVCRSHRCFWHGHQKALSSGKTMLTTLLTNLAAIFEDFHFLEPSTRNAIRAARCVSFLPGPLIRSSFSPQANRCITTTRLWLDLSLREREKERGPLPRRGPASKAVNRSERLLGNDSRC